MQSLKVPPQNLMSETAILGAIFLKPSILPSIQEKLNPSNFYRGANSKIYETMCKLKKSGDPIEPASVANELEKVDGLEQAGGVGYLYQIVDETATSAGWKYHVNQILDTSLRRELIAIASNTQEKLFGPDPTDEILSEIKTGITSLDRSRESEATVSISQALPEIFASLENGITHGIPSGFYKIDNITMGWQGGDLIIIAGRPGMGKSVIAKDFAENSGVPVLYFSLEMSKDQLIKRQISGVSGVPLETIRSGKIADNQWIMLTEACEKLNRMPIYYNDSGKMTIGKLCAISETYKMTKKIGLVVIDYLQLIRSDSRGTSREQEVSTISRDLKGLARDLGIPVICLAQLNRKVDDRKVPIPVLSDLRESGAIEQDADFVGFLYRPWMYDNTEDPYKAHFYLAKGRNTRTGQIDLRFFGSTQTFKNSDNDFRP